MSPTIRVLGVVFMLIGGCREQAQDEWLRQHGVYRDDVQSPSQTTQPAGPAQARPPAPPPAPPLTGPASVTVVPQTDAQLAARIRTILADDDFLRQRMATVDVKVRNGQALLIGVVPDALSRDTARRIAASVVGVQNVQDLLTVTVP